MDTIKEIVKLIMEKKQLESQYGWASCFDYPKEYDRMEDLGDQIRKAVVDEYGDTANMMENNFTLESLLNGLKWIADDIREHNQDIENEDLNIVVYTQADYIENFIVNNHDEGQTEVFNSLFYFMNSDHRATWLKGHYLMNTQHTYYDLMVDVVITWNI